MTQACCFVARRPPPHHAPTITMRLSVGPPLSPHPHGPYHHGNRAAGSLVVVRLDRLSVVPVWPRPRGLRLHLHLRLQSRRRRVQRPLPLPVPAHCPGVLSVLWVLLVPLQRRVSMHHPMPQQVHWHRQYQAHRHRQQRLQHPNRLLRLLRYPRPPPHRHRLYPLRALLHLRRPRPPCRRRRPPQ